MGRTSARIEQYVGRVGTLDSDVVAAARSRQQCLTKPTGSLGYVEELGIRVAGMVGKPQPNLREKAVIVMAADHGVAAEDVSAYPQEVTREMLINFANDGGAINVIARLTGTRVIIVDMGVVGPVVADVNIRSSRIRSGTRNFRREPAMTREEAVRAVESGIAIVEHERRVGLDIVATGDMGIANTSSSSAITAVLCGVEPSRVTGRGTGLSEAGVAHKVRVITEGIAMLRPNPDDPLDVLAKVGGLEIGGLVGVILGAAANRIPIVLDGLISGAAALVAGGLCPRVVDFLIAGHRSEEPGHGTILKHLNLVPLLDLGLCLGEGTGAVLALPIVEASVRILSEMATFDEAAVSGRLEAVPECQRRL